MGTRLSSWMILLFINGTFANFLDPPTIIPDASYISLQQYSDFDIKCVSEYPITWTTFEAFDGRYQISGTKNKTHYENTIHLLNITHDYVGFFFCVAEIKEFEYGNSLYFVVEHRYHSQMSGLNSIYVFVNDFSQILARQQETIIFRNEYLVVPCKPAMSSVHVKLFLDNAEVFAEYYKTIGFIIKINDSTDYYDKTFICTTSPPIDKNYQNITFRVTHNIPKLQPTTGFYLTMGEQMNLTCSVDILHDEDFQIDWYFGNVELKNNRLTIGKKRENHPTRNDLQKGISYVKIDKVIRADEGNYRCKSPQHHEYGQYAESSDPLYITILEQGDNSIEIRPSMILYDMYMVVNSYEQEAVWKCKIKGKPTPKLVWYDNTGRVIEESEKYEMTTYQELATLKINQIGFMDSGKYKLKADDVERTFDLVVNEAPYVEVRGPQSIINKNETVEFICYASGYPPSTITWTFTPCSTVPMWPSCEATSFSMKGELSQTELPQLYTQQSILKFTATEAGKVECTAVNSQGKIKSEALLKVSDIEDDFCIFGSNKNFQVGIGDNITLTCAASMYIYSDVQWYFRGAIVSADEVQNDTEASYRKTITWNGIQTTHSGSYECRSTKYPGILSQLETKIVNIDVREPRKPEIKGKIFDELYVPQGTNRDITCDFVDTTFPNPTITWHKNGTLISSSTSNVFSDDNKILTILKVSREDEGLITCTVENRLGKAEKSIVLKINDMSGAVPAWPIILGVTVIFIICFAFFYFRYRRLQNELKTAKIIDFDDGNPEGLNPDLALHEQADLLPYNKRYEFPRDKLKLGKQLGAGAFGVVTKAVATGILPYEEETIVAVKMLQKTADNLEVRALVTELKIMANLGQHLNVVNLLGAVTKNIERREVMVIVEYCQYGNLQNFLIKQRQNFINQINTQTGCIDPTILTKRECNESENGSGKSNLRYMQVATNSAGSETYLLPQNSKGSSSSTAPVCSNDSVTLSNNSSQSQSAFYKVPTRYFTTTDLLCWSFQVARGMTYLSSRKVLHGDLAARNILLCNDNVVKICDFGLARSLYKCNNYKKEGGTPLPLKWLALESISDQTFSTLSDVWSFGILMWELFSLGTTPYPGMEANQEFFYKLRKGYRMEKPESATKEVYDLMLQCWSRDPESRPLFNILEEKLRKVMDNEVAQYYVNLNEQYVQINAYNARQGEFDYITIMGGPAPEGYLPMKPIIRNNESAAGTSGRAVSNIGYFIPKE